MLKKFMMFGAEHRLASSIILLCISIFFGIGLTRLHVDTSLEALFSEKDPDLVRYNQVIDEFGSDNTTIIYVRDKNLFTPDKLARLDKLVKSLEDLPAVEKVDSLFSVTSIRDRDGSLESKPILETVPADDDEANAAKQDALYSPLILRNFISPDGDVTAINVMVRKPADKPLGYNDRVFAQIETLLDPLRQDFETLYQLGPPRIGVELKRGLGGDMQLLGPMSVLVLLSTVAVFLRKGIAGLFPLTTSLISLLWTFGFMGYCNIPVNILMAMLPSLIIVIGSCEDVHMMADYMEAFAKGKDTTRLDGVRHMASHMGMPIVVTSLTTVIGFWANAISEMSLIVDFSYAASFGIAINTVITFLTMPLMLRTFGLVPKNPRASEDEYHGVCGTITSFLAQVSKRHGRIVLALTALLVAVFGYLSMGVQVSNDPLSFFNEDASLVRQTHQIHDDLSGIQIFYITLDAGKPGAFKKPENIGKLAQIRDFISERKRFDKAISLADHLSVVNQEMHGGDKAFFRVPDSQDLVEQYLLFFQRSDLQSYVDGTYQTANIIVRHNVHASHLTTAYVTELKDFVAKTAPGMRVDFVGKNLMINNAAESLVISEFQSLALTLGIILIVMSALFTSFWAGLLSLVPNVIPIVLTYGSMTLMGITINPATAMVAAIAIGIAIDDTTHMLIRYNAECRRTTDQSMAIHRAMVAESVPVITSGIALAAGFLVLLQSNFTIIAEYGLLSGATMIYAIFADLLVSPILMKRLRLIGIWDILTLTVGIDKLKTSPLFQEMSTWQIKRTILLSELKTVKAGEMLIEQGTETRDMYLIVRGEAEVMVNGTSIAKTSLGDLVGEVAFVEPVKRTASVQALSDVEVLVFNFERVRNRLGNDPLIAGKVNLNISRILGKRLAEVIGRTASHESR